MNYFLKYDNDNSSYSVMSLKIDLKFKKRLKFHKKKMKKRKIYIF